MHRPCGSFAKCIPNYILALSVLFPLVSELKQVNGPNKSVFSSYLQIHVSTDFRPERERAGMRIQQRQRDCGA